MKKTDYLLVFLFITGVIVWVSYQLTDLLNYMSANNNADIIQAITAVVQTVLIVVGGAGALYKYVKHVREEIAFKVLSEVYAPLYAFIVRNDTFSYVANADQIEKYMPFMHISRRNVTTTYDAITKNISQELSEPSPVDGGSIDDDFLIVCKNVNIGLAPYELLTLMNMYKTTYLLTKDYNHNPEQVPGWICSSAKVERAWVLRYRIELYLRKAIVDGYCRYSQKTNKTKKKHELFELSEGWLRISNHDPKDKNALLEKFKQYSNTDV